MGGHPAFWLPFTHLCLPPVPPRWGQLPLFTASGAGSSRLWGKLWGFSPGYRAPAPRNGSCRAGSLPWGILGATIQPQVPNPEAPVDFLSAASAAACLLDFFFCQQRWKPGKHRAAGAPGVPGGRDGAGWDTCCDFAFSPMMLGLPGKAAGAMGRQQKYLARK